MNKVMLLGRLGQDPETKTVGTTTVTNANLATDESYKDSTGKRIEKTEWHTLRVWGAPGEVFAKFLQKGSRVLIEGRLKTETWETDGGNKNSRTVIVVSSFEFVESKPTESSPKKESPKPEASREEDGDDLPF